MKHFYLSFRKLLVSIVVWQLAIAAAHAQWSTDPTINTPICTALNGQASPTIVSDGAGGTIITWQDDRGTITGNDIYAQRVNNSGVPQWYINGVAICAYTGSQQSPNIVYDGTGGAIITWQDMRNAGKNDIFAQRVNSSGAMQWLTNGVSVCQNTGWERMFHTAVGDGAGGVIITWQDNREGASNWDIYAQRIDASGIALWGTNGTAICTIANTQNNLFPQIVSDGANGAIITWQDSRDGPAAYDIYAQWIDASGIVQWAPDGVAIRSGTGSQTIETCIADGVGGMILTWRQNGNIYGQRVNALGQVQWTSTGIMISGSNSSYSTITGDGNGGAIFTWEYIPYSGTDVYAQKIDATGNVQWSAFGRAICQSQDSQNRPRIISDGAGGAIITWYDWRLGSTNMDIYAQRVNTSGVIQWKVDGVAICTATGSQVHPKIASDGAGGAIITWQDARDGNPHIYVQKVNSNGIFGVATGIGEKEIKSRELVLYQNYPNPFNADTKISYGILQSDFISLKVYDLFGKEIKILVNEEKAAGTYDVNFDASGITPGIYVYKLKAGSVNETKTMIFLK
jgi:hypothetical protein